MIIDPDFISQVNELLAINPASVTRLVSTPAHNASVGGAPNSGHLDGKAVDLVFDSLEELKQGAKTAFGLGFMGIEVDVTNNHLHLDVKPRTWHVVHHGPGLDTPLDAWLTAEV
jgi:uncharacterized protein YcbK (DUF882 family)